MSAELQYYLDLCQKYNREMTELKNELQTIIKATQSSRDLKRACHPKYPINESCQKRSQCYFHWLQQNQEQESILLDYLKNDFFELNSITQEQNYLIQKAYRRQKEFKEQIEQKKEKIKGLKKIQKQILTSFSVNVEEQIKQTEEEIASIERKESEFKKKLKFDMRILIKKSFDFLQKKQDASEFQNFYKKQLLKNPLERSIYEMEEQAEDAFEVDLQSGQKDN